MQLDNAETLDGPPGAGDALDAGYVPPDRPYGLDEDGVTAEGMREGDSLDTRLRREQSEDVAAAPGGAVPVPRIVDHPADAEVDAAADDDGAFRDARHDLAEDGEFTGGHAPASGRDDAGPGTGQ